MTQQDDLRRHTLADIAQRCQEETRRFFRKLAHDARYCYELFRRAIGRRQQRAWELVYAQYSPLVAGWVERHSAFASSGEEVQYFVNRAFEKMWSAMSPAKFQHFSDLASVLRYLQMCVHSAILDHVRVAEKATLEVQADALNGVGDGLADVVEEQALDQVARRALWKEIDARLNSQEERRVVYGSFVLGLKPRELYEQYHETFDDVNHVYRVKENVLARLRRDDALRELLADHA